MTTKENSTHYIAKFQAALEKGGYEVLYINHISGDELVAVVKSPGDPPYAFDTHYHLRWAGVEEFDDECRFDVEDLSESITLTPDLLKFLKRYPFKWDHTIELSILSLDSNWVSYSAIQWTTTLSSKQVYYLRDRSLNKEFVWIGKDAEALGQQIRETKKDPLSQTVVFINEGEEPAEFKHYLDIFRKYFDDHKIPECPVDRLDG